MKTWPRVGFFPSAPSQRRLRVITPKLFTTLRGYTRVQAAHDAVAGVTVAMVALPLSIAIAIASGAAPETGLVTAVIGGFLISLLGGSRVQIGGPTGAFIVVVFAVIAEHGHAGLILATLMAGVILLAAALARAGALMNYVPDPVIHGFTIGIAIIIAASQLGDLLGLAVTDPPADFAPKMAALYAARDSLNLWALAVGLGAGAGVIALRHVSLRLPGSIIAVAGASALAAVFDLPVDTIESRFGALPDALPAPALPEITFDRLRALLPSALIIAFLAGVESLLSAIVADRMIAGRHRPNAELLAQGAANLGSALFGGLPATGAIARTATNVRAGGRTPVAGLIHAAALLLAMLYAAPLVGQLALPALAALLITTAWYMSEPHKWAGYLKERRSNRFLIALTLLLTVFADLTIAIGAGVAIGLALRLRRREIPPENWSPPER